MTVSAGANAKVELLVTESDTAIALRSGDVAVLATPRVVQICEEATIKALGAQLGPGRTSVGLRVEITHIAPNAVGSRVTATATLERCEGKRLLFNVSVNDECGLVAAGRVTRVVVDPVTFLDNAR
ncbi:MAG: thioesterase family protein [Acidimicrobiales bacterium]